MKFKYLYICIFLFTSSISFAGKYHPAIQYIFPVPESKMLSTQTTIIVRFHQQYLDQLGNLGNLIDVSGSRRPEYSGKTFYSTDNRTLIFQPDIAFYQDEKVSVTLKTSRVYEGGDYKFTFTTVSSGSNKVLTKSVAYNPGDIQVVEPSEFKTSSDIRVINGVSVPSDFPAIQTNITGETAKGKIFFGTYFHDENTGGYIIAVENDGTPCMYRRYTEMGNNANFVRQSDSTFSTFFSYPVYHAILDSQLNVIDTYRGGHGYQCDEHEFFMLPNGHALMILVSRIKVDMSQVVDEGNPNAFVYGNMIQEYDKDKNVVFEWRSWDHFNLEDAIRVRLTADDIDPVHMNSVSPDFDGHYILSSRHLSEVTKIDRHTGEIIWRLGGKNNQFEFLNDDVEITWQHHARAVPGKPLHYTLFDNGNYRIPDYSRAVEYKLDTLNMTAEKVWKYRFTHDRKSYFMGSVQTLPNGNIFMDWTHTPPVTALEVTPSGEIVFTLLSFGHSTYRSHRYDWEANYHAPYLILENLGYHLNLIYNKFGDHKVAYYKIYRQILPEQNFTLLDSTENTWYQVTNLENNTYQNYKVAAVSHTGIESNFSETVQAKIYYMQPGSNLIKNGNFSSTINWYLLEDNSGSATGKLTSNGYTIEITEGGNTLTDIKLFQPGIRLTQNRLYSLQFDASAEDDRYIRPKLQSADDASVDYSQIGYIALSRQTEQYSFDFTMNYVTDDNSTLVFECGMFDSDVTLNNVSLKEAVETRIENPKTQNTDGFQLLQNYPNPFNSTTTIHYMLSESGLVQLALFNIKGQVLDILVNKQQQAGSYSIQLEGSHLPSGVYLYQLKVGNQSRMKKLILLK